MNLLIVDDEVSLRDFLTIVFEEEGWRVETAASVADAQTVVGVIGYRSIRWRVSKADSRAKGCAIS